MWYCLRYIKHKVEYKRVTPPYQTIADIKPQYALIHIPYFSQTCFSHVLFTWIDVEAQLDDTFWVMNYMATIVRDHTYTLFQLDSVWKMELVLSSITCHIGPMIHSIFPSIIQVSNYSYKLFISLYMYIDGCKHLGQQKISHNQQHWNTKSSILLYYNYLSQLSLPKCQYINMGFRLPGIKKATLAAIQGSSKVLHVCQRAALQSMWERKWNGLWSRYHTWTVLILWRWNWIRCILILTHFCISLLSWTCSLSRFLLSYLSNCIKMFIWMRYLVHEPWSHTFSLHVSSWVRDTALLNWLQFMINQILWFQWIRSQRLN